MPPILKPPDRPFLLYYDPVFLEHRTGDHPENARRVSGLMEGLAASPLWGALVRRRPRPAAEEAVLRVHGPRHLESLRGMVERGGGVLDLENVLSEKSLDAALAAAGAGLDAVEAVWNGEASGAFCAVRPPGHHARPGAVMGFCLLNSAAIAARQAREILGLERVAILDIDVHHGNGIQEIFWRDPSVLYVSLHRYPLWPPGSGTRDETGAGRGLGANLNYPLPPTTGPEAYLRTLDEALDRVLLFKPDVLLVCAGFDTYREDPVVPGGLNLDQEHYGLIGGRIRQAAGEACDGRVVTLLEGGYNIQALPSLVEQYLQGLTGTLGKA